MTEERPKRRSRVLDYFETRKPEPESGDDAPFRGIDSAFGLGGSDKEGSK